MNASNKHRHLSGRRIDPPAITGQETAAELIEQSFLAYNAARLREGARLLTERMLAEDSTVALSVTGALTPAGLGMSAIIPLVIAYCMYRFPLGRAMTSEAPKIEELATL